MAVCGAGSAQVALRPSAGLPPLFATQHSLVPQSYAGDNLTSLMLVLFLNRGSLYSTN